MKTSRFRYCCAAVMLLVLAARPAMGHLVVYEALLSGPAEFPANTSPSTGTATVTIDKDLLTMRLQTSFSGLLGNTSAAHIHGPIPDPPSNPTAGVVTQLPSFTEFPLGVTSGSYDKTFDLTDASTYNPSFVTANGGSVGNAMGAFMAGMDAGKMYLNLHTSSFGGGEIRGFLIPVPEPASAALAAMATLGLLARRNRLPA